MSKRRTRYEVERVGLDEANAFVADITGITRPSSVICSQSPRRRRE